MSDNSPIRDFDAYRHEWDKNDYSKANKNNNSAKNKFSLNGGSNANSKLKGFLGNFFNSPAPFTKTVVAICVAMYVLLSLFPSIKTSYLVYNVVFASDYPWVVVTSAFVHWGLVHIFFNAFTLYYIGSEIEKMIGSLRIAGIFFVSVIGGSALTALSTLVIEDNFYTFTAGASGGIFGLFGAIFILQKRAGISTTPMIILIIINLSMGFIVPDIAIESHIGGLIFGLLITHLLTRPKVYFSRNLTLGVIICLTVIGYCLCFAVYIQFPYLRL